MKRIFRLLPFASAVVLALCVSEARAARALLAELLARAPAAEGARTTLTQDKLEACLREARDLDRAGVALDSEISAIEQLTAEAMFLQHIINMQIATLNGADEAAVAEFDRRTRRHEELSEKFKDDYPAYQKHQAEHDSRIAAFEQTCTGNFTAADLETAKAKLQVK